jgi:hypothetical protein
LREDEALELWTDRLLWNAIGKKSLRRGRSITHQTPFEDDELTSRLERSGHISDHVSESTEASVDTAELVIRTTSLPDGADADHAEELCSARPEARYRMLDPTRLCWAKNGKFINEKALEAWLMRSHDLPEGKSFRDALLAPGEEIIWAANYLPYGVAGANIDCVFLTRSAHQPGKVYVVELKRDSLGRAQRTSAKAQVERYCRYFERFLGHYRPEEVPFGVVGVTISAGSGPAAPRHLDQHREIHYLVERDGSVQFA